MHAIISFTIILKEKQNILNSPSYTFASRNTGGNMKYLLKTHLVNQNQVCLFLDIEQFKL